MARWTLRVPPSSNAISWAAGNAPKSWKQRKRCARGFSAAGFTNTLPFPCANLLAQGKGRVFVKPAALKPRAQRFLCFQLFGAFPAAHEMAFELGGTRSVHLAIEVTVQSGTRVITAHEGPPAPEVASGRVEAAGARGPGRTSRYRWELR